jgi:hypothetical protein
MLYEMKFVVYDIRFDGRRDFPLRAALSFTWARLLCPRWLFKTGCTGLEVPSIHHCSISVYKDTNWLLIL